MKIVKNFSVKKLEQKSISCNLTAKQREIIKLLQKKESLITDNKKHVFVTCSNSAKKVTSHSFYNLLNKGLVHRQTEAPFHYVLSNTGAKIKV